jgi:hypothetical protein
MHVMIAIESEQQRRVTATEAAHQSIGRTAGQNSEDSSGRLNIRLTQILARFEVTCFSLAAVHGCRIIIRR